MFKFKPTKKTYSDPIAATFKPGIPLGRKYSTGDMCLLHDGFQSSKVFLNSKVLRAALLNSKEYVEEVLEIKITDMRNDKPEIKDIEVIEADIAKGNVPKSGNELILDSEDLIVGNEDTETSDLTSTELPEKDNEETTKEVEGVNEISEDTEIIIDAPVETSDEVIDTITYEVKEDEITIEEKKTKKISKK